MGTPQVHFVVHIICFLLVCHNGVEGDKWNLTQEENFEIDRQLKLLTKPAIKTIVTKDGDVYDCVVFNKQPAFDNPIEHRETNLQVSTSFPMRVISQNQRIDKFVNIGFDGEGCPFGTVPLQKVTKNDLITERLASKLRSVSNEGNKPYTAVVRTDFRESQYNGAGALVSIHNPQVFGGQYSAARVKLSSGEGHSIEAGWRVDPTSSKTRFYIRTDVGQTHCFNTLCPGFVIVNNKFHLGHPFHNISRSGGTVYVFQIFILRDANGNWNLHIGRDNIFIGYWPSSLFDNEPKFAKYLEWGGEVYGPLGSIAPQMGAGHSLDKDTDSDAFFSEVTGFDENGEPLDPYADDLVEATDRKEYEVYDDGFVNDHLKRVVYYGGPGGFVL